MPEGPKPDIDAHDPGTTRGEEVKKKEGTEPGRYETEGEGKNRPGGKSTARDSSSVAKTDPIDPESPNLIPG
jgi:hypothetical protein